MNTFSWLQSLAGQPWARRTGDFVLRQYARRRVRALDQTQAGLAQRDVLLRLVRQAQATRFGRDHDFSRIRSLAEYQNRVPLRTYEAFWQEYWQPAFPNLSNVTWPGPIPYLAQSSGTTSGTTKYVPVSSDMLRSNCVAAFTTMAYFLNAHAEARVLTGRVFFLGGSTNLTRLPRADKPVLAGDLSGIAAREFPALLRAYTFPPLDLALSEDWDQKVQTLAEQSATLPITVLGGVPSWLLVLFERLRRVTGKSTIQEIWPELRLLIHGGTRFDPYQALFRREIGSDAVRFLDTYPSSEGYVASEDPRYGLLRLIPDHGIFFEFVPVDELDADHPTRHTAANVVPGVQYAVVLTTCAGLWSYLLGDTVCFERRDPPLLRFTGRTRYFLSAFGEHLISEEIERAVAAAATANGAAVTDFHVGPVFPARPTAPGHHRYLVEFAQPPTDLTRFTAALDSELCQLNEDYRAHRGSGGVSLAAPEVVAVRRGGFVDWMRAHGKSGGQHKVPRMDNTGQITEELSAWLRQDAAHASPVASVTCAAAGR